MNCYKELKEFLNANMREFNSIKMRLQKEELEEFIDLHNKTLEAYLNLLLKLYQLRIPER